ncbi:hypothetical protein BDQ12DRAFT_636901 [Crucibulum laeve]|uniref:RRM Nup35-type domain-containing protein n=1 Tax=Crucibulum laeve TaxID=68775 RepID=A0A5C3LMY5_9AGAR|nr:hypothetical protein BDQ12DRAFT_636901 [Crucibulum laeve]
MHNSQFTVAGMSASTTSHHSPNLNTWGSTSTNTAPFGESLSQSRSQYQTGYLMSASQANDTPQGNQRVDEVPVVQTKAKMNHVLARGSASEFGMDSMFQSTRQRQTLADEDAPPMSSINDIPNEIHLESSTTRFQPRNSTLDGSQFPRRHAHTPSSAQNTQQYLYIIVFGYPSDKYSVTAEYFKSLGEATDPDPHAEILNCFRIGYRDPADAMRAVRKNGEVLGGSWMIGAKWADPAQAEALLGQPVLRGSISSPPLSELTTVQGGNAMAVDEPSLPVSNGHTPTVGTPLRLVPSTSAFRKTGMSSKPATPQPPRAFGSTTNNAPGLPSGIPPSTSSSSTPNKSVLGQVSDLIFGW